jgi:hypothetical protein
VRHVCYEIRHTRDRALGQWTDEEVEPTSCPIESGGHAAHFIRGARAVLHVKLLTYVEPDPNRHVVLGCSNKNVSWATPKTGTFKRIHRQTIELFEDTCHGDRPKHICSKLCQDARKGCTMGG